MKAKEIVKMIEETIKQIDKDIHIANLQRTNFEYLLYQINEKSAEEVPKKCRTTTQV